MGSFDHVDKNFDSLKKIKDKASLNEADFKHLQDAARKFAGANEERCKPVPRLFNKQVWKDITSDFVNDENLTWLWSKTRDSCGEGDTLFWPDNKDE